MGKMMEWLLSFTKLGKIVTPIQQFLSGKKVYLGAAALGVPALVRIIEAFSDQGLPYLLTLTASPDWKLLCTAWIAAAGRAAITKAADPDKDPNAVGSSDKVSG